MDLIEGESACVTAVEGGRLACLKYAIDNGFQCGEGSLEVALKFCCEEWVEYLLHALGMRVTPNAWYEASKHIDRFTLLLKHTNRSVDNVMGRYWDGRVVGDAIKRGDAAVVELCIQHSARVDLRTLKILVDSPVMYVRELERQFRVDVNEVCCTLVDRQAILSQAIRNGRLELLRFLHVEKSWSLLCCYDPDYHVSTESNSQLHSTNINCLRYISANLEVIKYARILESSVIHGDTEAFVWALKRASKFDINAAARSIYFDVLSETGAGGTRCPFAETVGLLDRRSTKLMLFFIAGKLSTSALWQRRVLDFDKRRRSPRQSTLSSEVGMGLLDAVESIYPIKDFTYDEWTLCRNTFDADYVRLLIHRYVHPRALNVLRWMLKVRSYAWHWYGEWQERLCAEGGTGRRQDLEAFESDMGRTVNRKALKRAHPAARLDTCETKTPRKSRKRRKTIDQPPGDPSKPRELFKMFETCTMQSN